jgi:hypothetical protein
MILMVSGHGFPAADLFCGLSGSSAGEGAGLATLVVPCIGRVVAADDPLEPYQLLDADGAAVKAVASFLRELLAASRAPLALRSYAMDLLRWWRFLAAVDGPLGGSDTG